MRPTVIAAVLLCSGSSVCRIVSPNSIHFLLLCRLSTAGILQVSGSSTPTVAVVFDGSGEVAACVADVGLLEMALTPAVLRQHRGVLSAAPVVMVDGNLSPAAIKVGGPRPCHSGTWTERQGAHQPARTFILCPIVLAHSRTFAFCYCTRFL